MTIDERDLLLRAQAFEICLRIIQQALLIGMLYCYATTLLSWLWHPEKALEIFLLIAASNMGVSMLPGSVLAWIEPDAQPES